MHDKSEQDRKIILIFYRNIEVLEMGYTLLLAVLSLQTSESATPSR